MSEESTTPDLVELVRGLWASAARSDWEAILRFYAPDAVWDMSPMGLSRYEDEAGIRGLWRDSGQRPEGMVASVTIYPEIDEARAAAERLAQERE